MCFFNLKIIIRILNKSKIYYLINISGLALGIACTLLIFLNAINENSYDNCHKDNERIYRAVEKITTPKAIRYFTSIAWPISQVVMTNWLDHYAYKSDLNLKPFCISLFLTLVIAIASVGYHTVKASLVNPTDSLRAE